MQINKHNYEAYFLDFWENTLDMKAREALSRFLKANPELHDEFLDFKETVGVKLFPDEKIEFEGKDKLRKPEIVPTKNINRGNYEDYIIGRIEGDLTPNESAELEEFRDKNPQLLNDFKLYSQTTLKPDTDIKFSGKNKLKKTSIPPHVIRFSIYASVAAAILLFALVIVDLFDEPVPEQRFTEINPDRTLTSKPLQSLGQDYAAQNLETPEVRTEPEKFASSDHAVLTPVPGGTELNRVETVHPGELLADTKDFTSGIFNVSKLTGSQKIALLTEPIEKKDIDFRSEFAPVFDNMNFRDAQLADNEDNKQRGAFGRFLANLGDQILGGGEEAVENSLFGQVAEMGRVRISEIREDAPRVETVKTGDSKKTYFTINENLRIRISRDTKSSE